MGKYNKFTKSLAAAGFVLLSANAVGGEGVGTITFGTVQDVSVSQVTGLHFGDNYLLTSGLSCTVTYTGVTAGNLATDVAGVARAGSACGIAATGGAIVGGTFLIEGATSQDVQIRVTGASENDLTFAPAGNAIGSDVTTAGLVDGTAVAFTDDALVTLTLNSHPDSLGDPSGIGKGTIYVGGVLTADADLTAGATVSVNYTVEVTY